MNCPNQENYMLKSILAGLLTATVITLTPYTQSQAAETYEPNWESLDSRPTPEWFLNAKFGIFIHWGVYAVPAWAPKGQYAEWYWNHMGGPSGEKERNGETWAFHKAHYGADFSYADFVPLFTAELFNPDEWADIFDRAGAKYVVLTSKHHDGFCLFRSKEANQSWGRPWNSVDAGPNRDLLGDLGAAVRDKGLKMGFYYSLYEWFNPLYRSDRELFVEKHMIPQFKDVVTRYKPSIIFSDGEWDEPSTFWKSEELLAWLFNETDVKDEVVVNDRWGKNSRHVHGTYFTTEYASGMADASHPWEENRGMGHSYGFNRNEALEDYRTSRELTLMLVDLVSRGGNLLLNVGPTADGRIPVIMQQRLIDIGNWLDINGEAIYGTRTWEKNRQWSEGEVPKVEFGGQYMVKYDINEVTSAPKDGKAVVDAFFTCKGDTLYAIMPRWLGGTFLLKDVEPTENTRVSILGMEELLQWTAADGGIAVELPCAPPQPQTAWTLKVTNVQ
jgi:alpha-L-fucosidase